jgi:hypothetical protein
LRNRTRHSIVRARAAAVLQLAVPPSQETKMQAIILWLLGVPIVAIIALKLFGVF